MSKPSQKQEFAALDRTRYFGVNVPGNAQGGTSSEAHEVYIDQELLIDMSVVQWDEKPAFWEFISRVYPFHIAVVYTTLQDTPEMLDIELKSGYMSYVASRHIFSILAEEMEVALISEMSDCKGRQSIWRTTVTTVVELNERVERNKDLPIKYD